MGGPSLLAALHSAAACSGLDSIQAAFVRGQECVSRCCLRAFGLPIRHSFLVHWLVTHTYNASVLSSWTLGNGTIRVTS